MSTPQAIRGTQDIFGAEAEAFAHVVETFERVRKLYRFRRIEMPVFEKTEVFSRSIGETTDVVAKEMYSLRTRSKVSTTCANASASAPSYFAIGRDKDKAHKPPLACVLAWIRFARNLPVKPDFVSGCHAFSS